MESPSIPPEAPLASAAALFATSDDEDSSGDEWDAGAVAASYSAAGGASNACVTARPCDARSGSVGFVAGYDDRDYWNERYERVADGERQDWYLISFEQLAPLMAAQVVPRSTAPTRVLEVGCGNSPLCRDLAASVEWLSSQEEAARVGVRVTAVDYSDVLVQRLAADQRKELADAGDADDQGDSGERVVPVEYLAMDARRLEFGDATFDVVVEKATLDCLDCSGDGEDTAAVIREVARVLAPGGVFMVVTCRDVERRLVSFRDVGLISAGPEGEVAADADVPMKLVNVVEVPKAARSAAPDRQHALFFTRTAAAL